MDSRYLVGGYLDGIGYFPAHKIRNSQNMSGKFDSARKKEIMKPDALFWVGMSEFTQRLIIDGIDRRNSRHGGWYKPGFMKDIKLIFFTNFSQSRLNFQPTQGPHGKNHEIGQFSYLSRFAGPLHRVGLTRHFIKNVLAVKIIGLHAWKFLYFQVKLTNITGNPCLKANYWNGVN